MKYKRVFTFFMGFCFLLLAACSEVTSSSSNKAASTASSQAAKEYVAGDTVTVDGSAGKYSVTINSATISKDQNEFADSQPGEIIIIDYSYANISCKDDISVSELYFHVYDSDGKALETYPASSVKGATSISAGKHSSASIAYGLDNKGKQITLELYDIFESNRIATYTIDIK